MLEMLVLNFGSSCGSSLIDSIGISSDLLSNLLLTTDKILSLCFSSFRFESFESYDSRASVPDRDLYRTNYDYNEGGSDRNDSFGSHSDVAGNRRDQPRSRGNSYGFGRGRAQSQGHQNTFSRDRFMPSSTERLSARWNQMNYMGGRNMGGPGPGPNRLPSLFSQALVPECRDYGDYGDCGDYGDYGNYGDYDYGMMGMQGPGRFPGNMPYGYRGSQNRVSSECYDWKLLLCLYLFQLLLSLCIRVVSKH